MITKTILDFTAIVSIISIPAVIFALPWSRLLGEKSGKSRPASLTGAVSTRELQQGGGGAVVPRQGQVGIRSPSIPIEANVISTARAMRKIDINRQWASSTLVDRNLMAPWGFSGSKHRLTETAGPPNCNHTRLSETSVRAGAAGDLGILQGLVVVRGDQPILSCVRAEEEQHGYARVGRNCNLQRIRQRVLGKAASHKATAALFSSPGARHSPAAKIVWSRWGD